MLHHERTSKVEQKTSSVCRCHIKKNFFCNIWTTCLEPVCRMFFDDFAVFRVIEFNKEESATTTELKLVASNVTKSDSSLSHLVNYYVLCSLLLCSNWKSNFKLCGKSLCICIIIMHSCDARIHCVHTYRKRETGTRIYVYTNLKTRLND
jgi:hypothetical protein